MEGGGGGDPVKNTRQKKPREESTLDTLKECQTKCANAQEKAVKSAERLQHAIDNRVSYLSDKCLHDVKNAYKNLANIQLKLFNFAVDRTMEVYYTHMSEVKECDTRFTQTCIEHYMKSAVKSNLERPANTAALVVATYIISGTAKKSNSNYVPPKAVFRILYEPGLNFSNVQIPYVDALVHFTDSTRFVLPGGQHKSIPLSPQDEDKVRNAFVPLFCKARMYMVVCPASEVKQHVDLTQLALGEEFTDLQAFVDFASDWIDIAYDSLDDSDQEYLWRSFVELVYSRMLRNLTQIHSRVEADNLDNFECSYISPTFLSNIWPTYENAMETILKRRRTITPPLRRSAKSFAHLMHVDEDEDDDEE